jgi:hypothetical protein
MNAQAGYALLLAALVAMGCGGSPGASSGSAPEAPELTGNWQIASTSGSTTSAVGVLLTGALRSSGNQVTGTFRYSNLSTAIACELSQAVTVSGSIDTHDNLTLSSAAMANGDTIKISLAISGQAPYTGTIEVDGAMCPFPSSPAAGETIANASGTYVGALAPGATGSATPATPGDVTFILAQSGSPNSEGEFAATGTLSYAIPSCSGSADLSGMVSGSLVMLSTPVATNQQVVTCIGIINSAASEMTTDLIFVPAPCSTGTASSATYSGSLARQ